MSFNLPVTFTLPLTFLLCIAKGTEGTCHYSQSLSTLVGFGVVREPKAPTLFKCERIPETIAYGVSL